MKRLIVASGNKNKVREIKEIIGNKFDVISMKEAGIELMVDETGATFADNAMLKAKALFEVIGEPVLADDSGLCVDALDGAPGVYSARYAGEGCNDEQNNKKLLREMENCTDRKAKFVCAMVYYNGEQDNFTAIGETYGEIMRQPVGKNGFGYDPLFFSSEFNMGFAEASSEQKNAVSHRGRALNKIKEYFGL